MVWFPRPWSRKMRIDKVHTDICKDAEKIQRHEGENKPTERRK
jgi:hypothetical protein